jgi:hypothetical protein
MFSGLFLLVENFCSGVLHPLHMKVNSHWLIWGICHWSGKESNNSIWSDRFTQSGGQCYPHAKRPIWGNFGQRAGGSNSVGLRVITITSNKWILFIYASIANTFDEFSYIISYIFDFCVWELGLEYTKMPAHAPLTEIIRQMIWNNSKIEGKKRKIVEKSGQ